MSLFGGSVGGFGRAVRHARPVRRVVRHAPHGSVGRVIQHTARTTPTTSHALIPTRVSVGRPVQRQFRHSTWQARRNRAVARHKAHQRLTTRERRTAQKLARAYHLTGRALVAPSRPLPRPVRRTTNPYTVVGRFLGSSIHRANYGHTPYEYVGRGLAGPAVSYAGQTVGALHFPHHSWWNSPLGELTRLIPPIGATRALLDTRKAGSELFSGHPGKAITGLALGSFTPEVNAIKAVGPIGVKGSQAIAPVLHDVGKYFSGRRPGGSNLGARTAFGGAPGRTITKVGQHAVQDLFDLPAQAIPSAYYALTTNPAEQLKQFRAHDPIGRLLFHGDLKGIEQHPLVAALEVAGAKGLAGRGLGRVARLGGRRGPLYELASREREPLIVPGTKIATPRRFSPDIFTRNRQLLRERVRIKRAGDLRRKAGQAERLGQPRQARELRIKADKADPRVAGAREVHRRMDELVGANEDVRRLHRSETMRAVSKLLPRNKAERRILPLLVQGIVKADKTDLRAYHAELAREYRTGDLTKSERLANRDLRDQLEQVIASKRFDPQRLQTAAQAFASVMRPRERELVDSGMLNEAQAKEARLRSYAVRYMGAKYDQQAGRLVAPTPLGPQRVTPAQIEANMRSHGLDPESVSYVSQAPSFRKAGNFFRFWNPRPGLATKVRTGEAVRRGTLDAHPDVVIEQAARTQSLVDADRGFKRFADEFGQRQKDGTLVRGSYADMAKLARDAEAHSGRALRPVRLNPWQGSEAQLQTLLDEGEVGGRAAVDQGQAFNTIHKAIEDAVSGNPGEGVYGLVDESAADRLNQHMRLLGSGGGGKVAQMVNSFFRQSVLSTSPKWLTGNVVEAAVRTALEKAGPRSWYVGRRLRPRLSSEAQVRTVGGGHYSMAERQHIYRSAEQFANSPFLRPFAKALGSFWRAPGPKQVAQAWHAWTHLVFHSVNGALEREFQTALLGRYARENLMPDQAIKTLSTAIDQAARGLTNTNEQVAAGRFVDRAYGQYAKFSPGTRRTIVLYTPFVAWSLNAARFIFSVLPRDHPVATGLLASSYAVSEEWRNKHGLGKFIKNAVPGWLQGSIPSGKGPIRASRFVPFGAFTDPGETIASAVLPQYNDTLLALQGKDWKGADLHPTPSDPQKFANAVWSFVGSTVPVVGIGTRVLGGKGTLSERGKKELPFYPTKRTGKSAGSTSSGGSSKGTGKWEIVGGGSSSSGSSSGGSSGGTGRWTVAP